MIEVDARPGRPGESGAFSALAGDEDDDAALRAATAPPPPDPDRDEGWSAPAMRQIAAQSEPFASFLQDATDDLSDEAPADDWDSWASDLAEVPPPAAPSPTAHAAAAYQRAEQPEPEPEPVEEQPPVVEEPPAPAAPPRQSAFFGD